MKRITAISLLALLLYNAFGYYLLFAYEQAQTKAVLLQNIPDSAFQVLKLKVAVYASVEDRAFEYLDKDFIVENKTYHIVKKRIQNDTLNLYYLRDYRQDALRKSLNDILESQTFNNTSTNDTPIKHLLKSFIKDYIAKDIYVLVDCCPQIDVSESNKIPVAPNAALTPAYLSLIYTPPEGV